MGLCSLDLAKSYLKKTTTNKDILIQSLIDRASGFIDTMTNRILKLTTYNELYSGDGSQELYLDNYPVVTLSKLSTDIDKDNKTITSEIDLTEVLNEKNSGLLVLYNSSFWAGQYNIYVEYTAGYTDASDTPADLAHVCAEMVAKKFDDIQDGRIGISSKNIMSQNIVFNYADISKSQREVIELYRKPPEKKGIETEQYS